jgi:uncharacterized protein (TIGR03067 family)
MRQPAGMKRRAFLAATLLLLTPCLVFAEDLKDMEGTWIVAEAEAGGQKVESEELKAVTVKIAGDRYEVTTSGGKETGSLKLDAGLKPKTMDISPADGPNAGKLVKAIYEINGDTMRVCYTLDDGARPAEFATTVSGTLLITYKREKK